MNSRIVSSFCMVKLAYLCSQANSMFCPRDRCQSKHTHEEHQAYIAVTLCLLSNSQPIRVFVTLFGFGINNMSERKGECSVFCWDKLERDLGRSGRFFYVAQRRYMWAGMLCDDVGRDQVHNHPNTYNQEVFELDEIQIKKESKGKKTRRESSSLSKSHQVEGCGKSNAFKLLTVIWS